MRFKAFLFFDYIDRGAAFCVKGVFSLICEYILKKATWGIVCVKKKL